MKWFIVIMGIVNNQPVAFVEDNQPFDTPAQCEQVRAKLLASGVGNGPNPTNVICAGNNVVANILTGAQRY